MTTGTSKPRYRVAEGWGKLPAGWKWGQVAAVAVDSQDRLYAFNRTDHPVMVFDRGGNLLASWGEGQFVQPHGLHIDREGNLYLVDRNAHVVMKFTPEGRLLLTLGKRGQPSDTGATGQAPWTVPRAAGPFNFPTDVAVSTNGDLYVSDGYGNARVHKFSPQGRLLLSWGEPGDGPGQFYLPHSVWEAPNGRVYVADRMNNRIQVFTKAGEHVESWPDFVLPCKVFVSGDGTMYVAELGHRVTICTLEGKVLARWGGESSHAPGQFVAPHGICADSHGDVYVSEVLEGQRLQKFIRLR
ncbi:MAG: hypothetical protein HY535_01320 [Chloroflexi bacterium]|nr:hypothetical protein [Chloroflexota bacterium]